MRQKVLELLESTDTVSAYRQKTDWMVTKRFIFALSDFKGFV